MQDFLRGGGEKGKERRICHSPGLQAHRVKSNYPYSGRKPEYCLELRSSFPFIVVDNHLHMPTMSTPKEQKEERAMHYEKQKKSDNIFVVLQTQNAALLLRFNTLKRNNCQQ